MSVILNRVDLIVSFKSIQAKVCLIYARYQHNPNYLNYQAFLGYTDDDRCYWAQIVKVENEGDELNFLSVQDFFVMKLNRLPWAWSILVPATEVPSQKVCKSNLI